MTDELARQRATEFVLQQYHLTTLQEAQERLTPSQYHGVLREIAAVEAQLTAQAGPRPQPSGTIMRGINTPLGRVLPVTALLLVAIWVVFVLEILHANGSSEITPVAIAGFGATTPDTLTSGQYWRLLTACFLHFDVVHIASNSLALFWLGSLAELFYGPLRYLGIYLATGVIGNLVEVLVQPAVGAGASGAIFGLLGAMLIASWRNRAVIGPAAARQIFRSLASLFVLNVAISFLPNIGWAAHFGGAVAGAALALLIPFRSPRYPHAYAIAANVFSAILIVATLALAITWVGNHALL